MLSCEENERTRLVLFWLFFLQKFLHKHTEVVQAKQRDLRYTKMILVFNRGIVWINWMRILLLTLVFFSQSVCGSLVAFDDVDFNRDIRPILSEKCLLCHGPDPEGLEAGLRLDLREAALSVLESDLIAIVPGSPEESELIARITSADDDIRMPPPEHGQGLNAEQIEVMTRWVKGGAKYAKHWAYVKPERPGLPVVDPSLANWPRNPVDHFTLNRMKEHGLSPSAAASRYALARRLYLDVTGLPPSIEEVERFVDSKDPKAYENLVDELLQRTAYGEHWARKWLDLARYADSAGYADDPPRTIWAYRDWVINAYNNNLPFDQFTREQIAGDLLPSSNDQQKIATAFHRNTLTNNEGGTQNEEFRNVAVVDRVNTTMAVWMGTTMACAQCHTHKYDPITQEEYFQFFAILNNTEDSDRRNEAPLLSVFTDQQIEKQRQLEKQMVELTSELDRSTPELEAAQRRWETRVTTEFSWNKLIPKSIVRKSKKAGEVLKDGSLLVTTAAAQDEYTIEIPVGADANKVLHWSAIRLDTLPHERLNHLSSVGQNFVITGVKADLVPLAESAPSARFVRITNRGNQQILSLAEVQVFSGGENVASQGTATQHSTEYDGPPELAIDGNTDGTFTNHSVTHTATVDNPWWELDLGSSFKIERVSLWNRLEVSERLAGFTVELLNSDRQVVMTRQFENPPKPSLDIPTNRIRNIQFQAAFADFNQPEFEAADVLAGKNGPRDGWAVGGSADKPHQLTLIPKVAVKVDEPSILRIRLEQNAPYENHLLGHFQFSATEDQVAIERSNIPVEIIQILDARSEQRTAEAAEQLASHFRHYVAPSLKLQREELAKTKGQLESLKPATSVPVLRELAENRRETHLQHRGNYLDKGQLVEPGFPVVFHSPKPDGVPDRLAMADWLIDAENPLTARVLANRYWETIFGRGIVVTSEEFGSQGELPTHPQLLDWLATELVESDWDVRHLLKTLVMSATYRQSALLDRERIAADPDNRWLSRAPRVRLSAEMVRDQALFASGLLSRKMFGAPVKPPQPNLGLKAAFGGSTDWKTSAGEDRYRRGIYTTWRRSNPYPSMATFDAPNREVCTVRRNSTNTPLQSLVTLNDPVYVEAAQALARLVMAKEAEVESQIKLGFRRCLLRPPSTSEVAALISLHNDAVLRLGKQPEEANKLSSDPLGPLPEGMDSVQAAAMTVVCNVMLNLDEIFLKR